MTRRVGRPTVLDDETVSKLMVMLASGLSVSAACCRSGISREAYYSGLRNDTCFLRKIASAVGSVSSLSKALIVSRIKQGDVVAAKWWLRRHCRSEFN